MTTANHTAAPSGATDAVLKPSDPVPADSQEVQGIDFNHYASRDISVAELLGGYASMGFQATAVGKAVRIINAMRAWKDPESGQGTTIFLGYTSNLISSGLRETLRYLVEHKHVSAIVTTAGGVEEDFIKCLAPTYLGSFSTPGAGLRQKGMNRIGNLVVPNSNYCAFEDWVVPILDKMLEEQEASKKTDEPLHWTPSKMIHRLGKEINDERSVYYWAWKNDIPVFCPALTDGSLGDMLYFHTFKASPEQLRVDIVEDIRKINTIAVRAKRTGMVVLGGGVVKHHIANANLMRNGAESAVYINTAQEFDGSDAGARPDEAVSWGKIKLDGESVKVYAEATVVFPLIVAATHARACLCFFSRSTSPDRPRSIALLRIGLPAFVLPSYARPLRDNAAACRLAIELLQPHPHPPQSPTHLLHAPTPASPSPQGPQQADIDMSSSISTLPPAGQRHDREDADMQHEEMQGNGLVDTTPHPASTSDPAAAIVAVEVAAVDEDAMDTTPDLDADLVLHNPSAPPQDASATTPASPPPNDSTQTEPVSNGQTEQAPAVDDATQTESAPPIDPPQPIDPNMEPPPPPPPVEPVRSDSDSSDDDDVHPWHPIQEDTSSPDEVELKEIEEAGEHSALDHDYWESKAFLPLEEPEYTASVSGRIEWSIDAYNGTRENPNREIVMKSEPVTVGGHQWQINVYLEYSDDKENTPPEDDNHEESKAVEKEDSAMVTIEDASEDMSAPPVSVEYQHTPLPLLGGKAVPKRKCVAAQPRVNYSRSALHRFCNGSPDWGWTRFHGPYYDIAHRMRGQRQALLRDDKLAFKAYIRVVEDETHCLWEHHSRENPWDSFAMTGLQGLVLGEDPNIPDGNPFRKFLYSIKVPDPSEEPFVRPMPLLVDPGAGPVALDDVLDAMEWYSTNMLVGDMDVIGVWEALRLRIEEELQGTPSAAALESLWGPKRDYSAGVPSYRVPVVGVETMQEAINKATDFTVPGSTLPEILSIELERQAFDLKTRSYVKVLNKVSLDDHITVSNVPYTLYGFVVHKQSLHFSDSKDENQVKCLTKQQAIDAHEGKPGKDQIVGNDSVAYIVMYVRDDVARNAFTSDTESEAWEVPKWITSNIQKRNTSNDLPPMPPPPTEVAGGEANQEPKIATEITAKEVGFQIVESRAFLQHEGSGLFDTSGRPWEAIYPDHVSFVQLLSTDGYKEIIGKLATVLGDIKDQRQIKFWFLDSAEGSYSRPYFLGTRSNKLSGESEDRQTDQNKWTVDEVPPVCRRLWVHVVPFEKLPELPVKKTEPEEPQGLQVEEATENTAMQTNTTESGENAVAEETVPQSEDTPMSEPDEPFSAQLETAIPQPEPPLSESVGNTDTAMIEVDSTPVPDAPAVDVIIPSTTIGDTEMGGTQEDIPLPPPPIPLDIPQPPVEIMQPPPPPRVPTPEPRVEEIYFFLKLWNPEKQALESHGSHVALKSARVDETVVTLLGLPMEDKKKIEYWEEDLNNLRQLKHRRTFSQLDLYSSVIIIAVQPLTTEQRTNLAARAAFANLPDYIGAQMLGRNRPSTFNGHFTFTFFSSEHYKGEIKNGCRHGHGTLIYHSGDTYSGNFRLNKQHGHGLYTYQNGDTYDGEWVDAQKHGTGTFVEAATGNTYVGGWRHDKKYGEGVTHWKNAQEAERLCRICYDVDADAAFYDCGHVVACLACARELQTCPVCRKRVLSAMRLYYMA
ncbi:DS-domain-containing protein [Pyrenochaeta sp. DS3sAY3a]|nr:DS-domain-containing protein [Pyrenochaeta sp. DS3sAY3a]